MAYAKQTKVSSDKSMGEIQKVLTKAGASGFAFGTKGNKAYVAFVVNRIGVKINIKLPTHPGNSSTAAMKAYDQVVRTQYRCLLLVIKAKIESIEGGIETFEQAFLSHIVLKNGDLVGDRIIPKLTELNDQPPALLLGL